MRCGMLSSVKISGSVVSVGDNAFYGCYGLSSVSLPASMATIGQGAFADTKLMNEHADGLVIVDNCLVGCKGICPREVVIPDDVRVCADEIFLGVAELRQ